MTPLYSASTNSRHYNPYQRKATTNNNNQNLDLRQVELGIVSGSPLNRHRNNNNNNNNNTVEQQQQQQQQPAQQAKTKSGLLTKCVDWLFRNPSTTNKQTSKQPQQQQKQQTSKQSHEPDQPSKQQLVTALPQITKTIHHPNPPQSLFPHHHHQQHSNFNSLPHHHHQPQQQNRSIASKNDWFKSQSPFVSNPPHTSTSLLSINTNPLLATHGYSQTLASKSERRRPTTSHATLQIPFSSNDPNSLPNRVFGATINNQRNLNPSYNDSRIRSLSPFRQLHPHRSTRSPSAQIAHSSSFSSLGRMKSPQRTLHSTLGQIYAPPLSRASSIDVNGSLLSQKREHDQMSISPTRPNAPSAQPDLNTLFGGGDETQSSKRQMFYVSTVGFVTKEQRDAMKQEAEIKLREKEGRPLPTNEAEKILEILEIGRRPNSFLGKKRYTPNLPSIPVPTPSTASSQRTSFVKHLNRPNTFGTSLNAIYEEQALHSKPGIIIAPLNKKLEAERIKRLEEKKGQLRAELMKRKLFEESLQERNQPDSQDGQDRNGSSSTDRTTDLAERGSTARASRSASTETATEPASKRVKSRRRIGKLTSSSSKAKVNQGRKSRSQSVIEEAPNQTENQINGSSGRPNKTSRASEAEKTHSHSTSSELKKTGKASKNRKSPSPIAEEPENHHQQGSENGDQRPPELDQNTTCLHPAVRSSSVSLQVPFSRIAKSPSISSLRPGRTFSSRRHVKAKVFSAREEDLPPLNDGDDEEADMERDQLKKIKLPNTFVSSFRLEKFSAPLKSDQSQVKASQGSLPDKTATSSSETQTTSLFGQVAATPTTTATSASADKPTAWSSSSAATTTPSIFTQASGSGFLSGSKDNNLAQPANPSVPSSIFSSNLGKVQSAGAGSKEATSQAPSFDVFTRIPSEVAPPNFFGGVTPQSTTDSSSVAKADQTDSSSLTKADQPVKPSLFSLRPNSGAASSGSSLFKPPPPQSNSLTQISPFGVPIQNGDSFKPSEPQSHPSPFSFPTSQSTQPTCTNESASAALPAPSQEAQSNLPPTSAPTFSFGSSSSQAVSVFGSQPEPTAISAAVSQDTPNPTPVNSSINTPSTTPFTFGAQPTTTNPASTNNEPPASNGMCDDMFDANQPTSTTTASNIFGGSAIAPSNPMSAPSTSFSFGNVNTNTSAQTTKAELTFGGATSTTTTPSFSFGGPTTVPSGTTTGMNQTSGASLFGPTAPAVATSSSSSSQFTFGAPSGGSGSNSTTPFVFGVANSTSGSTITPTPGGTLFGQQSSSAVATPNNNTSSNVFNFGAQATGTNGVVAPNPSTSVFGNSSSSSAPNAGGIFGMNNNNNSALSGGSATNNSTPSFSFGNTVPVFGGAKPATNGSNPETTNNNSGLFGGGGFGKPMGGNQGSLFGTNTNTNNNGGNHGLEIAPMGANNNGGGTVGMFGATTPVFGAPTGGNGGMNNGMGMMDTNPTPSSIFGGAAAAGGGGGGGLFSAPAAPAAASPFVFSAAQPPAISFGMPQSSTSTPNPALQSPATPAPGGFVFNMGTSDRVTRKLPSSTRKPRR